MMHQLYLSGPLAIERILQILYRYQFSPCRLCLLISTPNLHNSLTTKATIFQAWANYAGIILSMIGVPKHQAQCQHNSWFLASQIEGKTTKKHYPSGPLQQVRLSYSNHLLLLPNEFSLSLVHHLINPNKAHQNTTSIMLQYSNS